MSTAYKRGQIDRATNRAIKCPFYNRHNPAESINWLRGWKREDQRIKDLSAYLAWAP